MASSMVRVFRTTPGQKSLLFQLCFRGAPKQCITPFSTTPTTFNTERKVKAGEGFWKKNERMDRPMSPHITIYSFPLPAVMSITNRVTGGAWSVIIASAGIGALVYPGDSAALLSTIKALEIPIWLLAPAKAALLFPFIYHTVNGVRHLVWDFDRGLNLPSIYWTGYVVFGLSALMTVGAVIYCS